MLSFGIPVLNQWSNNFISKTIILLLVGFFSLFNFAFKFLPRLMHLNRRYKKELVNLLGVRAKKLQVIFGIQAALFGGYPKPIPSLLIVFLNTLAFVVCPTKIELS